MKLINTIINFIVTRIFFRKKIDINKGILFIGKYRNIYLNKPNNEFFAPIIRKLNRNIKYAEIYFVSNNLFDFFNLRSNQYPFERLMKVNDLKNLKKNIEEKESKYFFKEYKLSQLQKYSFSFICNFALRLLKEHNPKIIIFRCSLPTELGFVIAAKKLGIKTVSLQDGSMDGSLSKRDRHYFLSDKTIVYSNYEKGSPTEKAVYLRGEMVSLGCPRYDYLEDYKINKKEFLERNNISHKKKILFWATQTHDIITAKNWENELNAECVFSTIKKRQDWFLLIKFHPDEDKTKSKRFYERYAKRYKVKNYLILNTNDESTYDCIYVSNSVILKQSTVGTESLLMGRPVINFELKKSHPLRQFKELNSSLIIRKKEDLNNYLNLISTGKYQEQFKKCKEKYISKHFSNLGHAAEKIAEFIEKELQK